MTDPHEIAERYLRGRNVEIEELSALARAFLAQPKLWECPGCAFTFDAVHVTDATGGHDCPVCELAAQQPVIDAARALKRDYEGDPSERYDSLHELWNALAALAAAPPEATEEAPDA